MKSDSVLDLWQNKDGKWRSSKKTRRNKERSLWMKEAEQE